MSIGTRLYTWAKGEQVGSDEHGNRYFVERNPPRDRKAKRWVIYAGEAEASKVPAEWHAWLHYTVDQPLAKPAVSWAKPHNPNFTGTSAAYLPPGHDRRGGNRERTAADYQPWQP